MIAKAEIACDSLSEIIVSACKLYRQKLAEVDDMYEVKRLSENLLDVARLWDAVDNFDDEDELLLTIERREEQEDGTDRAD
jgi:hypothetical protein